MDGLTVVGTFGATVGIMVGTSGTTKIKSLISPLFNTELDFEIQNNRILSDVKHLPFFS